MLFPRFSEAELNGGHVVEDMEDMHEELWPLVDIDPKKSRFPCCLVWTPLPVVSWLAPYIGHVGICREDGTILDFSGSNLVNVDEFAFGAVARYLQLDRTQILTLDLRKNAKLGGIQLSGLFKSIHHFSFSPMPPSLFGCLALPFLYSISSDIVLVSPRVGKSSVNCKSFPELLIPYIHTSATLSSAVTLPTYQHTLVSSATSMQIMELQFPGTML